MGNLAERHTELGELKTAEAYHRRRFALCREDEDKVQEAIGHSELGRLLTYRGAFDEAAETLKTALAMFSEQRATQSQCVTWAYRALRALLMRDANAALEAARKARELADEVARTRHPYEREFVRAEWLLGAAKVALAAEEDNRRDEMLTEAETHLTEALTRCHQIYLIELEPDILLAWARWHRIKGNTDEAHRHAEEALRITDRCEYRLKQADVHNFLSRLDMDAGARASARQHAEIARERALCDGSPHCYKPALEEAERLLAEIG